MKIYFTLTTIFLLFYSTYINAHQTKLIYNTHSKENPFIVNDPEISKAFYGKLSGAPHFFKIESNKEFLFYAGILSPKTNNNYNWLSLEVLDKDNKVIFEANGKSFDWKAWYEPYARDNYWKGPEIGKESNKEFKTSFPLMGGTYLIKVFNDNNQGHYSLAVGEAEFFGSNLWEQILTWTPILFYIGPYMDVVHWQKFDVRAYLPHIILLVLFFMIYFIFKFIFRKLSKN